ncbi:MAG: luxQ 2 [Gemmataceae bacterium]|nr:luxQ 2 [Gemmataceae bacterium]
MADAEMTNILVVDDLNEKLLAYRSVLDDLGLNVVTARSGEEALGHVLRAEFAVILLDVQMPGMDGFETAAMIRRRRKSAHTPIIFLTAFADEVRVAEGYAHGAVDYISTPAVPEILRAKVRVFVDLYRMTQQVRRQAEERIVLAEERSRREAAEEANHRLAFLAKVGAVLGQSLDAAVTARDAAGLSVPTLAGLAAVVIPQQRQGEWNVTLAREGPDGTTVEEGIGREVLPPDLPGLIDRVLAGDAPVPDPDADVVVLPLRARGRPFGALALARAPGARGFGGADLTVAEALASRAAIALENARLYQDVEEADRQKNEFLSMLAHELRNPLAPLQNAAEVIRLKVPNHPQVTWAREVIDRQLKHMVRLVDDLLDVSRITRGKIRLKIEVVNLADVVAHAVEAGRPLIDGAGQQFDLVLPPDPVWVNGDPARLAQVITNLLNNAAKYTERGGHIRLSLGRDDGSAVVRVRDTGIGIPPDMLGAVFDLFTQVDRSLDRSQGGLGIGLTLVHRLVTMHAGTVTAHSDGPGQGSEFVIQLPAVPAPVGRPGMADGPVCRTSPTSLSILLVDDNVDGAESLAALLRLVGHDVRLAHDGPVAVDAAVGFRPDTVILDIGLPGMNGYDVARRLRATPETAAAVLIAVTGYGRDEDRRQAHEAGFDHHLVKPVEFVTLRQLLATVAASARAPRATVES